MGRPTISWGRILRVLIALLFALGGGTAWWLIQDYQRFVKTPLITAEQGMDYLLPAGSSVRGLSADFEEAGLWNTPQDPYWFRLLARKGRLAHKIQAGEYHFQTGMRPYAVLQQLAAGQVVQYSVTLVEGRTFRELRQTLEQHPKLVSVLKGMEPDRLMAEVGHPDEHPEGRFLAETYQFTTGTTDLAILKRAYRDMDSVLQREWAERAPNLPYKDPYEALIMAAIIEKETAVPAERPRIAGVMVRRLQKGMRLQTDPTVIYGIGENFDGNLRRKDLRNDTPYNTYTRKGLPPTPIATPGVEAIHAALHPQAGNELYFVATGNGGHQFSATLKEHNRAVRQYQLKRPAK